MKKTVKEMYNSLVEQIIKEIPLNGKDSFDKYIAINNLGSIYKDIVNYLLNSIDDDDIEQIYDIYRSCIEHKISIPYDDFINIVGNHISDILFVCGAIRLYSERCPIIYWNNDSEYTISKIFYYRRCNNKDLQIRYNAKYKQGE